MISAIFVIAMDISIENTMIWCTRNSAVIFDTVDLSSEPIGV